MGVAHERSNNGLNSVNCLASCHCLKIKRTLAINVAHYNSHTFQKYQIGFPR